MAGALQTVSRLERTSRFATLLDFNQHFLRENPRVAEMQMNAACLMPSAASNGRSWSGRKPVTRPDWRVREGVHG